MKEKHMKYLITIIYMERHLENVVKLLKILYFFQYLKLFASKMWINTIEFQP